MGIIWPDIFQKGLFQGLVFFIEMLKELQKIECICRLKGPVFETKEPFPVFFPVIYNEIMGCSIHAFDQFTCFGDDGFSLDGIRLLLPTDIA